MKRLVRPIRGRVLGGVCAGIAQYFSIDPVIVRLGLVFLCFLGFSGLLAYIIGLLVIPSEDHVSATY